MAAVPVVVVDYLYRHLYMAGGKEVAKVVRLLLERFLLLGVREAVEDRTVAEALTTVVEVEKLEK